MTVQSEPDSRAHNDDASGQGSIAVLPLLDEPQDGVPYVIDTPAGLERAARELAAGTGPAAVDAERASGFRYGQRAFLVQIRREGAASTRHSPGLNGSCMRQPRTFPACLSWACGRTNFSTPNLQRGSPDSRALVWPL